MLLKSNALLLALNVFKTIRMHIYEHLSCFSFHLELIFNQPEIRNFLPIELPQQTKPNV